jgi:hypothetical protein
MAPADWIRVRGEMRDGVLHLDLPVQPSVEQQRANATCGHAWFGLPPTLIWGYLRPEKWCAACGDFWAAPSWPLSAETWTRIGGDPRDERRGSA